MYFEFHDLMAFVHVVLFVYAIGGDIAVYYIGRYVTREELSLEERLRVREMRFIVDMSARTSLVLLLPVGFTLALRFASPITDGWLVLMWLAAFAWLVLVWAVHFKRGTPRGEQLKQIDLWIRYGVAIAMISFGVYSLVTGGPIVARWLAIKIALYGVIIVNGIWIRRIVARWPSAFDLVRAGGNEKLQGEMKIKTLQRSTDRAALMIWILVLAMALIGQLKPF